MPGLATAAAAAVAAIALEAAAVAAVAPGPAERGWGVGCDGAGTPEAAATAAAAAAVAAVAAPPALPVLVPALLSPPAEEVRVWRRMVDARVVAASGTPPLLLRCVPARSLRCEDSAVNAVFWWVCACRWVGGSTQPSLTHESSELGA